MHINCFQLKLILIESQPEEYTMRQLFCLNLLFRYIVARYLKNTYTHKHIVDFRYETQTKLHTNKKQKKYFSYDEKIKLFKKSRAKDKKQFKNAF